MSTFLSQQKDVPWETEINPFDPDFVLKQTPLCRTIKGVPKVSVSWHIVNIGLGITQISLSLTMLWSIQWNVWSKLCHVFIQNFMLGTRISYNTTTPAQSISAWCSKKRYWKNKHGNLYEITRSVDVASCHKIRCMCTFRVGKTNDHLNNDYRSESVTFEGELPTAAHQRLNPMQCTTHSFSIIFK